MVKTPKTRHSKTRREPLTIELDPADVSRVAEPEGVSPAAFAQDRVDSASAADVETTPQASAGGEASNERSVPDETAPELDHATETGTATQPDQEYQPAESAQDPAGYRFDESESRRAEAHASPPREPAAPPATPPRSDGFSRVLAGVIGAVVALAGAGGLQYAGLLGVPGPAPAGGQTAEIESLRQEIAAIRDSAGASDLGARVDGIAAGLDAVKTDVASLREAAPAGTGGDAAALQSLDARIKDIETAVASLGQDNAPDAAAVTALGERVAAVEALTRTEGEAAAEADKRLAGLEQSVGTLGGRVDAQAQQPKIALAIATAALKSAVDRGDPFQAELETFAAIAPDAPELAALRAHAEKGVPTRETLLAEVEPAAAAMIAASKPVDPNAGILDRLMQSAESLVAVRPIGAVEGAGVPEIVARMEAALTAGDLDKAIAEFDTLPDTAKAAAGPFGEKLKARRDVERLVDQAIAGAMKA